MSADRLSSPPGQPPSVVEVLSVWADERLAALLARRPDLARPAPRDLHGLAERASSWPSLQLCRWNLDRGSQQVLDAICLLPRPTTVGALVALLGPPAVAADLAPVLHRLEDLALLTRRGDGLVVARGFDQLRYPCGLGPPLQVAMSSQSAGRLQAMARALGVRPGGSKASALAALARALSDRSLVDGVLSAGPARTEEMAADVSRHGPLAVVPGGVYGSSERTPVGWLASHGLLAPVSWDRLVMPREVGLALRGGRPFPDLELSPPPLPSRPADPEAVDRAAAERALGLVADIAAVVDEWGQAPPRVLKDGGIGVRDVRRAAKVTGRPEPEAARVVELAGVAGLVACDPVTGTALPTPDYDDWMGQESPARWAGLVGRWLSCELHPSLAGAIGRNDRPIPALLSRAPEQDAVARRRLVLRALVEAGPGSAVDVVALRRRVTWDGPDVWQGGPAMPDELVSWVADEAELLGLAALGSLAAAGRVAVAGWAGRPGAAASEDELASAAACLAARAPDVTSTFVLQADLTAVAPGELAGPVRAELELLADTESKGAATVYRFSEASLRRGLDAGRTAAGVQGFLEAHAGRGVPQPLSYLVADLGRRFGQVRVGTASTYVRSEDPGLLAEVLRARRTAGLGLRQVAPTVLVSRADPAIVLATMRSAGYLPALEGDDGGLVLTRPPARRAAAGVAPGSSPALDPAGLVAELRASPAGGASPGAAAASGLAEPPRWAAGREGPPGPGAAILPFPSLELEGCLQALFEETGAHFAPGDEEPRRPTAIARGRQAVRGVLELACDEEWMVRLAFTSGRGRTIQLSASVLALERDDVLMECLPRWDERTLRLGSVQWARVMTEAEEEVLMP
ncbi:MAG: helicase-associated domain-containing protein [Acidimicrobiales bacterium]